MAEDSFTDYSGTKHHPAGESARIISLVPSLTELLFDLDLAAQIVGRTKYCIHPAGRVETIPIVGGTKSIDIELVLDAGATHVVVNVDETPKQVADDLIQAGLTVIVTHPGSVLDNPELFNLIGSIFEKTNHADVLCKAFDRNVEQLRHRTSELPEKKVLYLIWRKPWMTISADTYIANTLQLVNWKTVAHDPDVRYPKIDMENILTEDIDLVLFSSEPFPFTIDHVKTFHRQFPDFAGQSAIVDAEMVSWYGSRAIPGLAYLCKFTQDLNL